MPFREEYNKYVLPFYEGKPRITIDPKTLERINDLVFHIIKQKMLEAHHHNDDFNSNFKRFYTGLVGEAAMEKYFGVKIIDWSAGNSNDYNAADLSKAGYNIGIKTVEEGKLPIVHKTVERPELINVKLDEKTVIFFGYAGKEVLKKYQSDEFVLSNKLRERGTKSAFYGFSELLPVKNFEELVMIYKKDNKL